MHTLCFAGLIILGVAATVIGLQDGIVTTLLTAAAAAGAGTPYALPAGSRAHNLE